MISLTYRAIYRERYNMSHLVLLRPVLYILELMPSRDTVSLLFQYSSCLFHTCWTVRTQEGIWKPARSKLIARFNTAKQTRAGGRDKNLTALSKNCSGLAFEQTCACACACACRDTKRMLCFIKVFERGRVTCSSYSITVVDTTVARCRVVILTFT